MAAMTFTRHTPRQPTQKQKDAIAWGLLELELAAPLVEPDCWQTTPIELVEEES